MSSHANPSDRLGKRSQARMRALGLTIVVLVLCAARPAFANTAPALMLGERHAPLVPQRSTNVRVEQERLSFDCQGRYLDTRVTATYRLRANAAESLEIAFAFVRAAGGYPEFRPRDTAVEVDGSAIEFVTRTDGQLLEPRLHAWFAANPEMARAIDLAVEARARGEDPDPVARSAGPLCAGGCPSLVAWAAMRRDGDAGLFMRRERALEAAREAIPEAVSEIQRGWSTLPEDRRLGFLVFRVDWTAGQTRELTIRYEHRPTVDRRYHVNGLYHFEYLLGPARHWADFGALDVSVKAPPGVELRSELPFHRDGSIHRARFDRLPDRELTFTLIPKNELWLGLTRRFDYWALLALAMSVTGLLIGGLVGAATIDSRRFGLPWRLSSSVVTSMAASFAVLWLLRSRLPRDALAFDNGLEPLPSTEPLVIVGGFMGLLTALVVAARKRR